MNKHSKYRPMLDDLELKIARNEISLREMYQTILETLDAIEKSEPKNEWISVDDEPDVDCEFTEWVNGSCIFDGMVSQSMEVTDGENWGRGHYHGNGHWVIYDESEHDFLNVEPNAVTHYKPFSKLPTPTEDV